MSLSAGTRLGPYEILDLLGVGGMGEVYRARDPRLGRDVAIKVLPAEVGVDPERLLRFEREARAVAALNHPNILTVFDVGTHGPAGGTAAVPYVVTELLAGENLRERLKHGTPGERQALLLMLQAARGLEAAHGNGIVHRDLKPENVFVTPDGRVKLLDFGLAKLVDRLTADSVEPTASSPTGAGELVGTVGYMSPEQVRGLAVDARSDVFSFGVVLYELLSGKHPFRRETTVGTLSAVLEGAPAELQAVAKGVSPAVAGIVRRCLSKEREGRYPSGHELAVALEAVAGAAPGSAVLQEVEEKSPYPGLLSFTETDAAHFFGRESEVGALWTKLRARKLLAVIAPSGAGKTSLVRAGVVASRPEGWAAIVSTPGAAPLRGLGQALVSQLARDVEALERILSVDDPAVAFELVSRWRKGHGEALLVVDQFEELFTLNPAELQERFAGLLGRLAREADVHVLLSLRDDFLIRCSEQEALAPVFLDLTPLPALSREGLRRAVEEPAKARGYRFEDEALVGEMVESVEGARAALPLLAFAVSRLWEKRHREKKLLTRAAYEEIGGVAGALAQHAEATLDRVGSERQGMVREIFRTLVTSQGTRAVAEREEVLSLFPDRQAAEEVLGELIDARLLTSYEVEGAEGQPSHHRVEIVHESLVKAWPRLVRWQAQDEEGAVLRDQLKQAARLWEEKGRTSDLLWTGTAYQEYALWRDRYAGALTALEEDFARAMAERAQRQKRLRRLVAGFVVAAALVVAVVTGGLWRRSEAARAQATAEAQRAEAGKLLALARTQLDADNTAALAYARASLDLFDTAEARRLTLEILWRGPVARVLDVKQAVKELRLPESTSPMGRFVFSPDGRWLAASTVNHEHVLLLDREGRAPRAVSQSAPTSAYVLGFGPRSDLLVTGGPGHALRYRSVPDLREIRTVPLGEVPLGGSSGGVVRGGKIALVRSQSQGTAAVWRVLDLPDGQPRVVAVFRGDAAWGDVDSQVIWTVVRQGRTIALHSLDGTHRRRVVVQTRNDPRYVALSPRGDLIAATNESGETRIWSTAGDAKEPLRTLQGPRFSSVTEFDIRGRNVIRWGPSGSIYVWDLEEIPDAQPLVLGRSGSLGTHALDAGGQWLAIGDLTRMTIDFYPAAIPRRRVFPGFAAAYLMAFTPDGRGLATCPAGNPARLWPLRASEGSARDLADRCATLAVHPTAGQYLVTWEGKVLLYPFAGGPPRRLFEGWAHPALQSIVAFDSSGRRALAIPFFDAGVKEPEYHVLAVFDLPSGRKQLHSFAHLADAGWLGFWTPAFAPDGHLYVGGRGGIFRLTLPAEPGGRISGETVHAAGVAFLDLSPDGRHLLVAATREESRTTPLEDLLLIDLAANTSRRITTHGSRLSACKLSPSGRIIVTGDHDGIVRVGPVTGGEPHVLLGHKGGAYSLAISPDERWIASSSDESISIWPMPDVTKPPLHTLPHAELLAKLDALTNLRVVRDPASPTGWKLDVGPFPGWKDVPIW